MLCPPAAATSTGYTTKAASLPLRPKAGQLSAAGVTYGYVVSPIKPLESVEFREGRRFDHGNDLKLMEPARDVERFTSHPFRIR
jgi:hypothetical protein